MNNEEQLSEAYSDLKDKYVALKIQCRVTQKEYKKLLNKYLDVLTRLTHTNNFLNKLLSEKWNSDNQS